jgi:transcriptional regulator with XRE-family HTH domain
MQTVIIHSASIMIDQKTFFADMGARIARLRKERGWSQTELGKRAGLSQQIVASYECGQREHLPLCRLIDLAEVLGVDLVELLIGENGGPRKRGPSSKMEKQIDQVRRLPKAKQRFVSELLENILK